MTSFSGGVVSGVYELCGSGRGVAMRSARLVVMVCTALLCSSAFCVSLAEARIAHKKIGEFSSGGEIVTGIAVNQTSGNIYVANVVPGDVVVFNPAHTEVLNTITGAETHAGSFGGHMNIAIDNASDAESQGDLYVPDEVHGVVDKFGADGHFICELNVTEGTPCSATNTTPFSGPEAVAVDPSSGNVYVSDRSNNRVAVFSPSGAFIVSFAGEGELALSGPRDIKVDSLSDVYVATQALPFASFGVVKFVPSSLPVTGSTTWSESVLTPSGNATAIAVTPTNKVYVASINEVEDIVTEYGPAGEELARFGGENPTGYGLGTNDTTEEIYYANTFANSVFVYNTIVLPTVVSEAASEVQHTSAKLNGTVNPEGLTITTCFFAYGEGQQIPCDLSGGEIGTGSEPVAVSAHLEGLEPGQTYPYHLVAEAGGHASEGSVLQFTTPPIAPTVTVEAATSITRTTALLQGTINPNNSATAYHFEYEYTTEGQTRVEQRPSKPLAPGGAPVSVGPESISELKPGTTYLYRIIATNAAGTSTSPNGEFATPPPTPPIVGPASASATSPTTATLTGAINPNGIRTRYTLEFGTDASYGTATFGEAGSSSEAQQVSLALNGLLPGTAYHFRLVASNEDGTVAGEDHTFTTPGFPISISAPLPAALVAFAPPSEPPAGKPNLKAKPLTRAQKLARALRACRKQPRGRRAACMKQAHRKYGASKKRK
jgi:DNA-binding beta-propeller fold protein YncE